MITRDSSLLWVGIISGVLGVLAAQVDLFPPEWKSWITLASALLGVVSGKLATSPLRGKNDPQ